MSKNPIFIGLGGLLRSGKDTVADHLVEKHGFVKMGMSDPLHESMMALNPVVKVTPSERAKAEEEGIYIPNEFMRYRALTEHMGYVRSKEIADYRRLLQAFGTEVVRDIIDPNSWVNIAERRAKAHLVAGTPVVLTGIRFENEFNLVQSLGSPIWVERPGLTTAGTHASESSVHKDMFQFVVTNDGTLEELFKITDTMIHWMEATNA